MPLKIVLDTNIRIAAFLSRNYSREIVLLAHKKKLTLVTSKVLNAELSEVFSKKIQGNQMKVNHFLNRILAVSQVVMPTETLTIIERDPDDNRVLEAAVEGNCQYIVTGDKDLLVLKNYKKIKILTAREFLDVFESK